MWKNITPRREHRERAQPNYRSQMGLLEKHKDYVVRAKDFHSKKDRLKTLKRKAEERNPDEFYFKMAKAKTKEGVHTVTHSDTLTGDLLKVLKTQDAGYVQTKLSSEEKKVEKLKASLHFLDSAPRNTHSVFVDTEEEAATFSGAAFLGTAPDLVSRTFNRPRLETLAEAPLQGTADKKAVKKARREASKAYEELSARIDRADKLRRARQHIEMRKALLGKGARIKEKDATGDAPVVYKWKPIRKK